MKVAELTSETTDVYPTPGMQLKTAREKLRLSLEEVAKRSFIPVPKLEALEADQYEKLPSPIFVQGYLRKVAPMLKLDSNTMVSCYNDYLRQMQATVEQVMQAPDEVAAPVPVAIPPKWIVSGALTGVALLILALVYVFVGDGEESSGTQTSELIAIEANPSEPADAGTIDADETVATETGADISGGDVDGSPGVAVADSTTAASQSNSPAKAVTASVPPALTQLAFGFIEECWLKVEDGNGETIHAALHAAGEPVIVEGVAPLTVLLGNAKAATVTKNGEPVAIEVRPGHRTATLTIE